MKRNTRQYWQRQISKARANLKRVQQEFSRRFPVRPTDYVLDFLGPPFTFINLSGDASFILRGAAPVRTISVCLKADNQDRKLHFPKNWTFIGRAPNPVIPARRAACLSLAAHSRNKILVQYSVE